MHLHTLLFLGIYVYQIGAPVKAYPVESGNNNNIRITEEVAAQRLALLREQMILYNIDAYIITTSDAHQTAYLAERDKRRSWVSGFTGSAGTAVVTLESAALWTDSRYYEEALQHLSDDWILMRDGLSSTQTLPVWLTTVLSTNTVVGVDPELVTYSQWTSWSTALGANNVSLMALDDNLINIIWKDQPEYPSGLVFEHPIEFAGMTREEKLAIARAAMVDAEVDLYVITALDEVAWVSNLRGSDIPHTPIFRSYLLITNDTATIYIPSPQTRLNETLAEELTGGDNSSFVIAEYDNFWNDLATAAELATTILLPASYSYALGISYRVHNTVPLSKIKLATSPVLLVKDRKTELEANGMRNAHIKDAVALCTFLARLEAAIKNFEVYDELRVVEELSALRRTQEYSFGDSFDTIAGYGPNSALPHYTPTNETNVVIGTNSTFMLDSGGQYYDGTTDVTRSMHYGTPTEEHRDSYTALLAGCIDLARLIFPVGRSYTTTDILMRSHLYRLGRNYGHGSTHGVGHFLAVHEDVLSLAFSTHEDIDDPENHCFAAHNRMMNRLKSYDLPLTDTPEDLGSSDPGLNERLNDFENQHSELSGAIEAILSELKADSTNSLEQGRINAYHCADFDVRSFKLSKQLVLWTAVMTPTTGHNSTSAELEKDSLTRVASSARSEEYFRELKHLVLKRGKTLSLDKFLVLHLRALEGTHKLLNAPKKNSDKCGSEVKYATLEKLDAGVTETPQLKDQGVEIPDRSEVVSFVEVKDSVSDYILNYHSPVEQSEGLATGDTIKSEDIAGNSIQLVDDDTHEQSEIRDLENLGRNPRKVLTQSRDTTVDSVASGRSYLNEIEPWKLGHLINPPEPKKISETEETRQICHRFETGQDP